jgi:hypothetical protein
LGVAAVVSLALAEARVSVRAEAVQVEADHLAVLDCWGAGPGTLRRPADKVRVCGEWRNVEAQDWDGFYALSQAEQARLRRSWFAPPGDSAALGPDELADKLGCSSSEAFRLWLDETRVVDACRAVQLGRPVLPDLYGGLDVDGLFASEYSARALYGDLDDAETHVEYVNGGCQVGYHGGVDPVEQYAEARHLEAEAARLRADAIERMLAQGKTVAQIALELGISRQAANEQCRKVRGDRRARPA